LELQPPDHFLLIEPDEELSRIVAMEMAQAATLPVTSCSIEQLKRNETLEGAIPAALPRWAGRVRLALPSGSDLLTLSFRSVTSSLAHWLPAPSGALVGITSRWPQFLTLARTMLVAAGFHADALVFRDAREPNWRRGLKQTAAVICDSLTAKDISKGTRVIVFPLLSESSITGLRRYREFVRNPIAPLQM
jgi:GntR family transcriptional regulator